MKWHFYRMVRKQGVRLLCSVISLWPDTGGNTESFLNSDATSEGPTFPLYEYPWSGLTGTLCFHCSPIHMLGDFFFRLPVFLLSGDKTSTIWILLYTSTHPATALVKTREAPSPPWLGTGNYYSWKHKGLWICASQKDISEERHFPPLLLISPSESKHPTYQYKPVCLKVPVSNATGQVYDTGWPDHPWIHYHFFFIPAAS